MARIYIARSTGIGSFERHVVLKLITQERANDTTAVQMFLDEARLAACLNHQNVAQVFEVGEDAGIHYLAMEYVHGQDLRALLAKAGSQGTRVPLELALTTVAGAAAGLNHAHERRDSNGVPLGIVHRDVSPSNIMVGLDGSVKLLDFGIAKATQRTVETQAGIIKGKFAYMAPEQCRGRDVDRRSDVFSLGIILYEITTQHRCFRAESDFDTMHRIVTGDVVRPTRLVQGYPQALEAIVMKALAIDPNQRYQSAGALLEAIESFAVSARMSLSTMSLGRFMREMFGETPEPWLMNHAQRASQPSLTVPKESTISNTNGSGSQPSMRHGTDSQQPDTTGVHSSRTVLDLPRSAGEDLLDRDEHAEWNAKSYPTMQPAYASTQTLPPEAKLNPAVVAAAAAAAAATGAASPPVPVAPPTPTPALADPAVPIVSTRHGYASAPGRNDVSYPRYEPTADVDPDVELTSSKRPLFIGLAILALGVIAVVVVSLSGRHADPPVAEDRRALATEVAPDTAMVVEPPQLGSVQGVAPTVIEDAVVADPNAGEESISIRVISVPPGADVLLAGKPIGTTPLDTKIKRGTGSATLVVHRAGYDDVPTKIDLTGDFSKEVELVKVPDKQPPPEKIEKVEKVEKKPPPPEKLEKKPPEKRSGKGSNSTQAEKKPPPEKTEKKPPCQPPGQIDPFDSRPVCR
jgi:serine/threonine-protein kinase